MDIRFQVIPKLKPIYSATQRYIVMWGGRGGGKSFETARYIIIRMIQSDKPMRILCCREIQKSIKESVYILLVQAIYDLGLQDEFEILASSIRSKRTYDRGLKSEVFFNGIKNNVYEIKSMANVDICWVEEAANVSQDSWDILLPTIRSEGSQVILTFNPTELAAPTHKMFVTEPMADDQRLLININYWDNPFITDTLLAEMERMKKSDYERYLHHWEGQPLTLSNAVIFKGKFKVQELEEEYFYSQKTTQYKGKIVQFKYGMDFGFATDPFACVECFMQDGKIYITRELYWHGMENVDIVPMLEKTMPELVKERRRVYADSAYPATISQLSSIQIHPSGERLSPLNIQGAIKGKGSVEEGINWLRGFEIIVNPNCKNMIYELSNYKYKTDKDTGEIMAIPEDKNNHLCVSGDTLIDTEHGYKPIQDLVGKDIKIWAYVKECDGVALVKASNIMQTHSNAQLYKLELGDNYVKATADHLFLTNKGWQQLKSLKVGDHIKGLFSPMGSQNVKITNITKIECAPVYNMYVEEYNTFFCNRGIISHNCDALRYAFNEEIVALRGAQVRAIKFEREHARRKSPIWN